MKGGIDVFLFWCKDTIYHLLASNFLLTNVEHF